MSFPVKSSIGIVVESCHTYEDCSWKNLFIDVGKQLLFVNIFFTKILASICFYNTTINIICFKIVTFFVI